MYSNNRILYLVLKQRIHVYELTGWWCKISANISLFMTDLSLYLFIFIIPIILYLKLRDKVNPFEYLKLKDNLFKGILTGFFISTIFIISLIIKNIIVQDRPINLNIGILWISGLLVGILEEIPFRGFILQKLLKHFHFWLANLLTTILFVTIHIPIWLSSQTDLMGSIISISLVSLVLGYLFKEYDSLWVPITVHSIFNLATWIGLR